MSLRKALEPHRPQSIRSTTPLAFSGSSPYNFVNAALVHPNPTTFVRYPNPIALTFELRRTTSNFSTMVCVFRNSCRISDRNFP